MSTVSDFFQIPKIDSCKHLSSGMSYTSFVQWAGFKIPDFNMSAVTNAGSEEDLRMRAEVSDYAQLRIATADDIFLLFCESIADSVYEKVASLNGTINVDFVSKCKNSAEFLDIIKKLSEKYSGKIKIKFFLGMNSDNKNNLPLADMLLESGLFSGIELYGNAFVENPEKFIKIFKTARKMNIDSRISCLGLRDFKDRDSILEILQNFCPTSILNPNIAISREKFLIFEEGKIRPEVAAFLKQENITTEFSPAPLLSGVKTKEKLYAIREFADKNLPFSLCTEDFLYLKKSLCEFASDLCDSGLFSKEEIIKIISN